jgi:hypothetical protein
MFLSRSDSQDRRREVRRIQVVLAEAPQTNTDHGNAASSPTATPKRMVSTFASFDLAKGLHRTCCLRQWA